MPEVDYIGEQNVTLKSAERNKTKVRFCWAKKLARILTDTLIGRLPDCATIRRNRMLWP